MDTKELLDKYKKSIGFLIDCKPEELKFMVRRSKSYVEIGSINYEKRDDTEEEYLYEWCQGEYMIMFDKVCISSFKLYEMPHCCAFLISCKSFVNETLRGRGIATVLNNMRQDIGRILGYSAILCTDIAQNEYQRKVLSKNGWKDVFEVDNKRTGNHVFLSVKTL